jgi:cobalt/nickel transport system ATP-binding protein
MHHNTINVEHISFAYPDGRAALQDVSLHVRSGEKVALIGPNGAGKSTLLLHLNGLLKPQVGRIRVCGLDVRDGNLGAVRAAVGLVFQDPNDQLFCPTIFEDIAFGPLYQGLPEADVRTRVTAALEAVGMADFAARSSYRLSLGEKKRVALATVLSLRPQILVLDEPSAGLDPRARRSLIQLLITVHPTLLIASHDLELVLEVCDRVVLLDEGRVFANGKPGETMCDVELMEAHGLERPHSLVHHVEPHHTRRRKMDAIAPQRRFRD